MPSYTETWDESKPAGTRDRSLGDDDIREFKRAIRERLATDHVFDDDESGFSTIGYHTKVTFVKQGSNATSVTDTYILFCKNDGSTDELFGIDESGNVIQFTDAGKLAVLGSEGWRTGDKLLSSNTNTPTGWTDQSATYEDNFIRISSGTPLTAGGSNSHTHAAGSYAGPSHTHSGTTDGVTFGGGGTLTAGALDTAHTHTFTTGAGGTGAVTGTSASSDNVPVYIQLKMYSKT